MTSALNFLVAARRCEIDELEQLANTGELVDGIGRLVHALQMERGLCNLFLGSAGRRFAELRRAQIDRTREEEQAVRAQFAQLCHARRPGNGARLFSRVAWVTTGLESLCPLRQRIDALALGPDEATAAYVKLIAGLLAVVFEAADGATDPQVSRWLVAMFNFMQAKELAGQERACGAAAFTRGRSENAQRQQWLHLIESQERCFEVFADFADEPLRARWLGLQRHTDTAELERLRRVGCAAPGGALPAELGAVWFDCCTRRMDAMRELEDALSSGLHGLCEHKIAQARLELDQYETLLAAARQPMDSSLLAPSGFFGEPAPAGAVGTAYGRHLERSVLDLVQEQSRRLQAMGDELNTVRASLNERKLVERAKGLLMAHQRLNEAEAHKLLRQTAMNQNRRLIDVAESVLAMAELLPGR